MMCCFFEISHLEPVFFFLELCHLDLWLWEELLLNPLNDNYVHLWNSLNNILLLVKSCLDIKLSVFLKDIVNHTESQFHLRLVARNWETMSFSSSPTSSPP